MPASSTPPKQGGTSGKPVRELERVAIRFAGDSGDGMQITGSNFTEETALADAMVEILSDDALREQMGRRAAELVLEGFTWPQLARRTLEVYERLCAGTLAEPTEPRSQPAA